MNSGSPSSNSRAVMSEATVARLTTYLGVLQELGKQGRSEILSDDLAKLSGTTGLQVRKDFHLSPGMRNLGTRGQGYGVDDLLLGISRVLQIDQAQRPIIIIGGGHLGEALAGHSFRDQGFSVIAIFDTDKTKSGKRIGEIPVFSMNRLRKVVEENGVETAIIAVPAYAAQGVADLLERMGVSGILNFAPTVLEESGNVAIRNVDLGTQLEILKWTTIQNSRQEPQSANRQESKGAGR